MYDDVQLQDANILWTARRNARQRWLVNVRRTNRSEHLDCALATGSGNKHSGWISADGASRRVRPGSRGSELELVKLLVA